MKGDQIIHTQLLIAQAFGALADQVNNASGYVFSPVTMISLPEVPAAGTVACIKDSSVNTWGGVVAGGGFFTVLAFYNGTQWKVIGA
jgi:hypothetical protein